MPIYLIRALFKIVVPIVSPTVFVYLWRCNSMLSIKYAEVGRRMSC